MKAFCINLDDRTDRRDYIFGTFGQLGIDVERFSAVNGKSPDVAAAAAALPPGFLGEQISAGAYACFMSHRAIWARIYADDIPHAIIFEDDLLLAPAIVEVVRATKWPDAAEIIRIETFGTPVHLESGAGLSFAGRRIHRLRSKQFGTGGYALTRAAAERLLQRTDNFRDPIDRVMFDPSCSPLLQEMNVFQMVPAPVTQGKVFNDGAASEIASWKEVSIDYHSSALAVPTLAEHMWSHFKHRLRQEARARWRGTRYMIVPYG